MKMYVGVEVQIHLFSTTVVGEVWVVEWSPPRAGGVTRRKEQTAPNVHDPGGGDPLPVLTVVEKRKCAPTELESRKDGSRRSTKMCER